MDQAKKGFLPVLQGVKLSQTQCPTTAEDREKMKDVPYASAIGSIMYAMLCTRPDVCLAISFARMYQSNPGMDHWTAVKNILKYLKRTKDMFLVYGGDKELIVNGYVDASFDTDPDDSKSQTGYVFTLNGGAVSWCSSKQSVVAGSTCEAEYIAASEAANEGVWMKHIKRHFNSIRDLVKEEDIDICKIHTDLNVADTLTKPLPRAKHDQHQSSMGVRIITV